MKKKIMLFVLCMFMFITSAKAASFDVNITSINYKGNNGTKGSISTINLDQKEMSLMFESVEAEVIFDVTMTNSGKKAGTLESIDISSSDNMVTYTSNFPSGGLSIDGKGSRTVRFKAKLKSGARNVTYSSNIKLTYNYSAGSCPDGEVLSADETRCLCPGGKVRNSDNVCATPETTKTCGKGETYNKTTKKCEKKEVVPGEDDTDPSGSGDSKTDDQTIDPSGSDTNPDGSSVKPDGSSSSDSKNSSNPKTMDNIILITLLFLVSGLGIYAALFNKLKTNKTKVITGVIVGMISLGLSFTVLVTVFGIDNLLGAIINPVTQRKEITIKVNETVRLTAVLDWGSTINGKMKRVAGNSSASYNTEDYNIIYIRRSRVEPSAENKVGDHIISDSSSQNPVYIWFDNGTLYWWSAADDVYFGTHASWICAYMKSLKSVDIEDLHTDNALYMDTMFYQCSSLESLDLSNFNTSNVQNMSYIFNSCSSLTSLDLSGFDTKNVTNMSNMFGGCSSLTSLDLSGFNTKNVQDISWFINNCNSLTTVDISGFDLTNATSFNYMFAYNPALTTIYSKGDIHLNQWQDAPWIFYGSTSLVGGNGTTYDSSYTDATYARIDIPYSRGYFTAK